uniref:Uncharacterized protein n=1 Tax=Sphaerodactylus townsendi TaxID=933632 RepID=A0ACB8E6R4_9SAUR
MWSLSCFFVSASTSQWISTILPHIISRMGKSEQVDINLFCLVAIDFYRHQIDEELDRRAFQSVFEMVATPESPYRRLLTCLQNVHKASPRSAEKGAKTISVPKMATESAGRRSLESVSPMYLGASSHILEGLETALIKVSETPECFRETDRTSEVANLRPELAHFIKGAFQEEKAAMREEMLNLFRSPLQWETPQHPSQCTSPGPAQPLRENKRASTGWETRAALKRPRLSPDLISRESSGPDREEGEFSSGKEELEDTEVPEQASSVWMQRITNICLNQWLHCTCEAEPMKS